MQNMDYTLKLKIDNSGYKNLKSEHAKRFFYLKYCKVCEFLGVWGTAAAGLGQGPNFNMSNQIWVNGSVNLSLEYGRKTLPQYLHS